jgi:hypothetical protein
MPCQSDEEDIQPSALPAPVTPRRTLHNDVAGHWHDNSDAERAGTEYDEEQESVPKKKRKLILAQYVLVKLWVTG